MTLSSNECQRVLVIDDNPSIHDDFRKILRSRAVPSELDETKSALFGTPKIEPASITFELTHASQGEEGLECVQKALAEGRPFAVAFIDVRMPPGWDGIETTARIWEVDPSLQVIICTAYSDYTWDDIRRRFRESENLLILKKPFDNIEVLQFAYALTAKWKLMRSALTQIENLEEAVAERTKAVQQSEERFSKAFRRNPLPMFIQTLEDERILDANPAFYQLIDRPPEDVLNRSLQELGLGDGARLKSGPTILDRSDSYSDNPTALKTRTGEERRVLVFTERFEANGRPCRLVLMQDVTERMKIEADLRQAQKMEAIGQLAAGVAHDFNNILTVIQGQLSLALLSDDLGASTVKGLTQALKASERAGALTRQLLAFSRKQVMERKPLTLVSLFEQVKTMLLRLMGDHIEIRMEVPPDLPSVYADRCNIEQVLINLAVNARDAMPGGGKLTIDAFKVQSDHRPANAPNPLIAPNGAFVCIRVKDTGQGMNEHTKARIFDPFFTTKEVGKGTGMGLATVHGIIKQHQGWIEVDTAPGQGTTFRVYLPLSLENGVGTARPFHSNPPMRKGHETILLVEDETAVIEFAEQLLSSRGYRVLTAANAAEAIAIWERESKSISLLFTDIVMPGGMNGKQLADKLKAEKPELHVIYSSGYSLELAECDLIESGIFLLQKPYTAAALEKTVRDCFEGIDSYTGLPRAKRDGLSFPSA